jgi:hypothetical protein
VSGNGRHRNWIIKSRCGGSRIRSGWIHVGQLSVERVILRLHKSHN